MERLNKCRDNAERYYGDALLSCEKPLAQSLFDYAKKTTNSEDQGTYFDAVALLKKNSDAMHATFKRQLGDNFQAFVDNTNVERNHSKKIELGALSLLNSDELEDELAISVIVSKSNSLYSEQLWKLNRRLAVLRGGRHTSDETNPFGPASVCDSIQIAMAQLSIGNKPKIFLYKQLSQILIPRFKTILTLLNEELREKGVLPHLRFSVSRTTLKAKQHPNNGPDTRTGNKELANEPRSKATQQHEIFNAIRQLQAQQHIGAQTHTASGVSFQNIAADGKGGDDSFSTLDYALALSVIQHSKAFTSAAALNRPLAAESVEIKLFNQLNQQANPDARHKMTFEDANTVDLVGMIFRYMLDDSNLNDAVKSMLSHLHTPYLKLALMDKTFLNDVNHPARKLLNSMAAASVLWVKDDKDRKVLPKVKSIIKTILDDFVDDASIFDTLLEDFLAFKENLEKRSKMVEKRNKESQQGLERLEISKQRATEEIITRLEQSQIPENISHLLQKTWGDFLSFNLLRHGDKSQAWQSALKVVDGVIWSVGPSKVSGSAADIQQRQNDLERMVSEGLKTMGYDQDASTTLLSSLRDAQQLAFRAAAQNDNSAQHPQNSSPQQRDHQILSSDEEKTKRETMLSKDEQIMNDKVQEIAFGTWFEFQDGPNPYQLKLAWYSQVTSHYMFVDSNGVKQVVKMQTDLAKDLAAGDIHIIIRDDRSFMERAFESVLGKLKVRSKN